MKFKFSVSYFILTILLFVTEVLIACYLQDAVIRPFGGDFLVVILLYCFVKSFANLRVFPTAIGVLLFAYLIELSQYFNLVYVLGLGSYRAAVVVLGSYFSWGDILAYTLGIGLVIWLEQLRIKRQINKVYTSD